MNPCFPVIFSPEPGDTPRPDGATAMVTLRAAAMRLDVPESRLREWLSAFQLQRSFDGEGQLLLSERDVEFLRLVKSLKDVDRSCDSIVRLIEQDPAIADLLPNSLMTAPVNEATLHPADGEEDEEREEEAIAPDLAQIQTLKAELRDLHAKPAKKPFWKFW